MLHLLELDDQVGSDVPSGLMTKLLEYKLCALIETRLHLDLLHLALELDALSIMLHDSLLVVDLLDRAVVELLEAAVECDNDVLRLASFRLFQATKAVREDARVDVSAAQVSRLGDEVSLGEHSFKVGLWLRLQEVTASDFLCNDVNKL